MDRGEKYHERFQEDVLKTLAAAYEDVHCICLGVEGRKDPGMTLAQYDSLCIAKQALKNVVRLVYPKATELLATIEYFETCKGPKFCEASA